MTKSIQSVVLGLLAAHDGLVALAPSANTGAIVVRVYTLDRRPIAMTDFNGSARGAVRG